MNRKSFLKASAGFAAGLAVRSERAAGAMVAPGALFPDERSPRRALSILVLGGTGFIGPHMVRYAVERGHRVSIFTRGNRDPDLPDSVERLVGDRNDDHAALEGRRWDVVLDNNSQDYRWVKTSTQLLGGAVEQYVIVSSISAYAIEGGGYAYKDQVRRGPAISEDSPRFGPPEGWRDGDEAPYGLMKSLGEDLVRRAFPARFAVVRPGLIVGPGDLTDRFTYWPLRIAEGGDVLAPGNPEHANQVIDQRDLTEWIVRLAESGTTGDFNATGPASRMSMAEMLYGIRAITGTPVDFTWVSEDFLEAQRVSPWSDLPAWMPGNPLMAVDVRRAIRAGLTFRPLAVTARDTLAWDRVRPAEQRANRRAGLTRERERQLLEAWRREG